MTKKKEVSVATTDGTSTDLVVPQTTKDVPNAIAKLKELRDSMVSKENKEISLDVTYEGRKIKDIKTATELLEISAAAHSRNDVFEKALERHNMKGKVKTFQIEGHSIGHWDKVLNKALFELENRVKIKQIDDAISKLEERLDEDTKLQNDMQKIMANASKLLD